MIFHIKQVAAEVVSAFSLPTPLVWIEHHGPAVTDGATETWELVVFSRFGKPSWKPLDRGSVEVLVGKRL